MNTYKTPGVYVEEISTFPPSVAEVSTAIPVFIGRTEAAGKDDAYIMKPVRISTFLDYTNIFGGAQPANYDVTVTNGAITQISRRICSRLRTSPVVNSAIPMILTNSMKRENWNSGWVECG